MKSKLRFLLLISIASLLIGTLSSTTALAGGNQGAGETKLEYIKNHPCGSYYLHEGNINWFTCSGWAGAESWITIPLTYWETVPEYPFVNYPFYIGLGTRAEPRPGTNATYYFPKRDAC